VKKRQTSISKKEFEKPQDGNELIDGGGGNVEDGMK
jgi:hypothetical protein